MHTNASLVVPALLAAAAHAQPVFTDATDAAGLGGISAARVCLADLNADGRPDAVIRQRIAGEPDRYRVFLNQPADGAPGFRFVEVESPTGLPVPRDGDVLVFADIDGDGFADAVFARYLDVNNEKFTEPESEPKRTAWLKGRGDGTFGPPSIIEAATPATTSAVAVGDIDRDGLLDLYLGNWYTRYGQSYEAFKNDLLAQRRAEGGVAFTRIRIAGEGLVFDESSDRAGRPTYGAMILSLWPDPSASRPALLDLNYGRRANRLWLHSAEEVAWVGNPTPEQRREAIDANWQDGAVTAGLDGDHVRHGVYPTWLKELAKEDPRFARQDEKRYRSHGNTFDAAVGDIDNDGDFDLFFAEITHAWAGESSDRSRFLVSELAQTDKLRFSSPPRLSVDRIPPVPPMKDWPEGWRPRWNQGDLFCELADLDHDGRLDLILSSGDYPDEPPYDQRLRIFHQQEDGTFKDVTSASGIDHVGSQQISLGDVDGDGDLDILVGQSFTRFTKEMIDARTPPGPVVRVFLNQAAERRAAAGLPADSITLKLVGDESMGINRDALGAIVEMVTEVDGREVRQLRQLIGVGGHAGKQHEFLVHFGLGGAAEAKRIEVRWPAARPVTTVLEGVPAGRHTVRAAEPTE